MAAIDLEGVTKTYPGGVTAVSNVSLPMADGEFTVLVGPSGCGKSTLLRMIAGLETTTDGTIRIGGRVVNRVEPADRDIAMVFQNYTLYPHMSVRQNMSYGLKNRGVNRAEIDRRVNETAAILQLETLLERRPRELSGGQRQRVAMGRAIVREPAAFLFDEPLSNLDAKLRVEMRAEIKQLQKRLGTTSVYVTHDQLEAMTLGDRLVVINGGKIEQTGTPLEIFQRPQSVFVAGFVGSPAMNLLDCHCQNGKVMIDDVAFDAPGITDGAVRVGIRAHELRRAPVSAKTGNKAEARSLAMKVLHVEELGAERLIHGEIHNQKILAMVSSSEEVGEIFRVMPNIGALHFFDARTGSRIELSN